MGVRLDIETLGIPDLLPGDCVNVTGLSLRYDDTYTIYNIIPEENYVYFFPSWVKHRVEPNDAEIERISVSFNTWWKDE
jgi:hypothetical protein